MELTLNSKKMKVKKKVEIDHYWYDSKKRQMLQGRGGRMEFTYDPIQKRTIPIILDHEEWVDGDNYDDIKKWVRENSVKYDFTVESDNGKNITISIGVQDLDDVLENLYRHGIVSDY